MRSARSSASDPLIIADFVEIEKGKFIRIDEKKIQFKKVLLQIQKVLLQKHILSLQFPLLLLAISSFPLSNENGVYGKIRFFIGRMGAFIVPAYTLHTRGVESSNLPSATEKSSFERKMLFFVYYKINLLFFFNFLLLFIELCILYLHLVFPSPALCLEWSL